MPGGHINSFSSDRNYWLFRCLHFGNCLVFINIDKLTIGSKCCGCTLSCFKFQIIVTIEVKGSNIGSGGFHHHDVIEAVFKG